MRRSIHEDMRGRWQSLLPMLGVDARYLTGKHGPCPICQDGKDRFRFDDKAGKGTWICSYCGSGTGVDLVMRIQAVEFGEAVRRVRELLPETVVRAPRNDNVYSISRRAKAMWEGAAPLTGLDPASRYLANRGIQFEAYPSQIRYLPQATYWSEDRTRTAYPAMIAQFVSPDAQSRTYHVTYLTGDGRKAPVQTPRKILGPIPKGGAVRLAQSGRVLGVAEGIETALSAAQLFDVPVWAALNAGSLIKFVPPEHVRRVMICADADDSMTGQCAAYTLAYRLRREGFEVEVMLPEIGTDWNDVLLQGDDDGQADVVV